MNNHSIAIIDYGRGNLHSVYYGLKKIGADPIITNDEKTILEAPRVILPGVGAFGDCMDHLAASGLEDAIFRIVEKGTPFLGICVGLQLLFEGSEETPGVKGLGIFKGRVRLIRTPYKIPHMGWNELTITRPSPLLKDAKGKMVYFVHSFAADLVTEISSRNHRLWYRTCRCRRPRQRPGLPVPSGKVLCCRSCHAESL